MKNEKIRDSIIVRLILTVVIIFIVLMLAYNFMVNNYLRNLSMKLMDNIEIPKESGGIVLLLEDAYLKSTTEFRLYSFTLLLILISVGSLIFYFVIGRMLKPLKVLIEKINIIDINNSESLKVLDDNVGGYEIKQLSRAFNEALKKIQYNFENQKQFSSNVAHELRTPIAVIRSKIDIFKKREVLDEQIKLFLDSLDLNINRLAEMVDQLLFLSRDKNLILSQVNVNTLVEEVFFDLSDLAEEKNITLEITGFNLEIETDDGLLQRMIFNIIENSIKYNNPGGKVEVELRPDIHVILIKDTGIGIVNKEEVFDLFYREDQSRNWDIKGYGIGLPLVKK